jgi:hypothetical protein
MAAQMFALQQERATLINEVQRLTYNQNVGVNSPQHPSRQQQDSLHVQQLNAGLSFLGHGQAGGLRPFGGQKSYGTSGLGSASGQGDPLLGSRHDEGLGRRSGDGPGTASQRLPMYSLGPMVAELQAGVPASQAPVSRYR